jgi:hypothetical protein
MATLRELASIDRFPYLTSLGLDPDEVGRLDIAPDVVGRGGLDVYADSGTSLLLEVGDQLPAET